jgi:hypothetical protein
MGMTGALLPTVGHGIVSATAFASLVTSARLLTVGHRTLRAPSFASLATGAGLDLLADGRSHPGGCRRPQSGAPA